MMRKEMFLSEKDIAWKARNGVLLNVLFSELKINLTRKEKNNEEYK